MPVDLLFWFRITWISRISIQTMNKALNWTMNSLSLLYQPLLIAMQLPFYSRRYVNSSDHKLSYIIKRIFGLHEKHFEPHNTGTLWNSSITVNNKLEGYCGRVRLWHSTPAFKWKDQENRENLNPDNRPFCRKWIWRNISKITSYSIAVTIFQFLRNILTE